MSREYTIVKHGVIPVSAFVDSGHFCDIGDGDQYNYTVEVCVRGELVGPDYFIVENSELDTNVQGCMLNQPRCSCEKMADMIVDATIHYMQTNYARFTLVYVKASLIGGNGTAGMTVKWTREA